jgi:hypothetical protein
MAFSQPPNPVTVSRHSFHIPLYVLLAEIVLEREINLCFLQIYALSFIALFVSGCILSFTRYRF